MQVMLFLLCFTVASITHAGQSIFDLRERLQFTKTSQGEVTFQYCKLSDCKSLNSRSIGKEFFNEASKLPALPTGIAKQILTQALSTISRSDYGVAGAVAGDEHFLWANCRDKSLQIILNKAKKAEDFLIRFDTATCNRSDVAGTSVKREAEFLRNALKELVH